MAKTIAAIIAEFNPFHNGHKFLVEKIKLELNPDYIIAIMSGDFVERGEPAICDKFLRAENAICNGIDAVFELPAVYSSSAAPDFAFGSVSVIHRMHAVRYLCFGSECGDTDILRNTAIYSQNETDEFKKLFSKYKAMGLSYPLAHSKAFDKLYPEYGDVLKSPNNTLGVEYIKALMKFNSFVTPVTFKRFGVNHDSDKICNDSDSNISYLSASAIRNLMCDGTPENLKTLKKVLPSQENNNPDILSLLNKAYPVLANDFSALLMQKIDMMSVDELSCLPGANKDIALRLKKKSVTNNYFTCLANAVSNKSVTRANVNRLLIHTLLGIFDSDIDRTKGVPYLRLLAMNKNKSGLINIIKENSEIPVITKMADFDYDSVPMLKKDIYAANLYNRTILYKFNREYINDITNSPRIKDI